MSLQYRSTFADSLTILWSIDLNRQQYFAIAALVCMACTSFASDDQDKKKPQAEKSEAAPLVLTNSSGAVPDFSVLEKELGILPSDEAESSDPQDKDPKAVPVEKIARRNSGNDVKTEVVLGSNKGEQKSAESSAEADASVGQNTAAEMRRSGDVASESKTVDAQRPNHLAWSILEATLQLAPSDKSKRPNERSLELGNEGGSADAKPERDDDLGGSVGTSGEIPSLEESSEPSNFDSSGGPERVPTAGAKPMLEAGQDAEKECPGAPDGKPVKEDKRPGDVELEQSDHPFDAPPAKHTIDRQLRSSGVSEFTQREREIHQRINTTLNYYLQHPENVVRRGPWALMHAALPFGVETDVIAGRRRVNAIGWMCYNGVCARQRMFQPTRTGFRTNVGPGVQGHEGQFLAILAQSRVQPDYPIKIGSRRYTINDLVRYEMATCRERSELTFKLIGLSYYLEQEQRWRDNRGGMWNLEKLLREELAQPINGQACGGTHRLMAISYALRERQKDGLPVDGIWARAEAYETDYVAYTMSLQNPDGSFSTEWFEGRGNKPDVERKVQTTGHMLEWLIYILPEEQLRSPQILSSLEYLLNTVGRNPQRNWPIGPRGHALRAMMLYNQRVFDVKQGEFKSYLAKQPQSPLRR